MREKREIEVGEGRGAEGAREGKEEGEEEKGWGGNGWDGCGGA